MESSSFHRKTHEDIYKFASLPIDTVHEIDKQQMRKLRDSSEDRNRSMKDIQLLKYIKHFSANRAEGWWSHNVRQTWHFGLFFLRVISGLGIGGLALGTSQFQEEWANEVGKAEYRRRCDINSTS